MSNLTSLTEKHMEQKQKEIKTDQAALSASIKEMIDSSMIFTQLKHQSAKLIERKKELEEQQKKTAKQLQILDENYKMTMNYIQLEEST